MSKITDNCLHSGKERRPYGTVLGLLQGRILPQECSSSCGFCSAEDHTLENYEVASEVSLFVSPLLPGGEPQRTADVVLDKETADKKQKAIYKKNLHILSPEKRLLRSPATDVNSSSSNQTGRRTPAVNARASLGIRNSMKKRNSAVPKVEGNQSFSCWRVMYGIPSSRKHKKWEDQGVLIVEDRNKYILKSNGGKELARKHHVSLQDVEELEPGLLLIVGSKEIEIMEGLSEESFKSGSYLDYN